MEAGGSVIERPEFKIGVSICVVLNTIQMGLEADNPSWTRTWLICENFFTLVFFAEAVLKLRVLRKTYFHDRWNCLDVSLVVLSIVDIGCSWIFGELGADLQVLSILRLARLCRLARVLRLVQTFEKLVVVINGVIDAMQSTLWVAIVLFLAIYMGAVFCVGFLGPARLRQDPGLYPGYHEDSGEIDDMEMMSEFNPYVCFGSMSSAMLTLFNIAILSEWSEVVRPIMIKDPPLIVFFIFFVLFVTFGVMNVIIGMIVDNVMQSARKLQEEQAHLVKERKKTILVRVQELVYELDVNQDHNITWQELEKKMSKPDSKITELLEDANLHLPRGWRHHEFLGLLATNGDAELDHDEFVQGLYRLIDNNDFQQGCMVEKGINDVKRQLKELTKTMSVILAKQDSRQRRCHFSAEGTAPQETQAMVETSAAECGQHSTTTHIVEASECTERLVSSQKHIEQTMEDAATTADLVRAGAEPPAVTEEVQSRFEFHFDDEDSFGLEILWSKDGPCVGATRPDGPARAKGMLPGDAVLSCNGCSIRGKPRHEILKFLQQRPIRLVVRRDAASAFI